MRPAGAFDRPHTPEEIMDELDCVLGLATEGSFLARAFAALGLFNSREEPEPSWHRLP
jgi:hypothetical protein